jgi:hypothetical protein
MYELWTIIFVAALAVGFGVAASHDREKARRRARREAAFSEGTKTRE